MEQEYGREDKSLNSFLASSSQHKPTSTSSRTYFKVFLTLSLVLLILCSLLVTTANCTSSREITLYDTPEEETVRLYMDRALNTDVKIKSQRSTCSTDEVLNVCKRCAKATRVPAAEQLCCDDIGNTKDWCQKILNFKLVVEANTGTGRNNNRMLYIRRILGRNLKRMT